MISNKTGPFLRVREKTATKNYIYGMEGSPPRVRGKERVFHRSECVRRITPACAGKRLQRAFQQANGQDHPRVCGESFLGRTRVRSGRDHPRVCGEKVSGVGERVTKAGSPPRVRGKADNGNGGQSKPGITPACAGKR